MGRGIERRTGFIKSNMAIGANAKDLDVNRMLGKPFIIALAFRSYIFCRTIRDINMIQWDIDMVEQIFHHEIIIALGMSLL